jgi:putative oxidoreductase
MHAILARYEAQLFALMRIIVGLLFACHGAQKLFGLLGGMRGSGNAASLFSMIGAAGLIEFVAGLMVALGIFAAYAAFIASGQMAVAYFMVHFPNGFWPIQNGGELAVLYCWVFLYISARGSGKWSLTGK